MTDYELTGTEKFALLIRDYALEIDRLKKENDKLRLELEEALQTKSEKDDLGYLALKQKYDTEWSGL